MLNRREFIKSAFGAALSLAIPIKINKALNPYFTIYENNYLDISTFSTQMIEPAMHKLADEIDKYISLKCWDINETHNK